MLYVITEVKNLMGIQKEVWTGAQMRGTEINTLKVLVSLVFQI